jgi:hypothetical protein
MNIEVDKYYLKTNYFNKTIILVEKILNSYYECKCFSGDDIDIYTLCIEKKYSNVILKEIIDQKTITKLKLKGLT